MTYKIKLKPCPFCGHQATLYSVETDVERDVFGIVLSRKYGYVVKCNKCSMKSKPFSSQKAAIAFWEKRPADLDQTVIAVLEEALRLAIIENEKWCGAPIDKCKHLFKEKAQKRLFGNPENV